MLLYGRTLILNRFPIYFGKFPHYNINPYIYSIIIEKILKIKFGN